VSERTIAHLDCDAFYFSVELLRRPALRGKPVVIAGSGPRAVVTTASYEARRFGVGSATPASRARRLCPEAIFVEPDFDAYRRVSREIMERVRSQVDTVEVVGLDEAYLDLTGLMAPRAAMRRLISEIRAATGITCSIGIGPNKLVAKVASDAEKPAGFVVLTREEAGQRFGEQRPRLLPGIGAKTAERLEAMGISNVAALAASSEARLAERFGGRLGPYLRQRARFEDSSPVSTERVAVSESRETTFSTDVADRSEQEAALYRLADELCAGLARNGHQGRTIAIKVRLDDFTTVTRARTLSAFTNEADTVRQVAVDLLREFAPPRPVRLLGVRVASFEARGDTGGGAASPGGEEAGQLTLEL
jgi:DNA polymerase-4